MISNRLVSCCAAGAAMLGAAGIGAVAMWPAPAAAQCIAAAGQYDYIVADGPINLDTDCPIASDAPQSVLIPGGVVIETYTPLATSDRSKQWDITNSGELQGDGRGFNNHAVTTFNNNGVVYAEEDAAIWNWNDLTLNNAGVVDGDDAGVLNTGFAEIFSFEGADILGVSRGVLNYGDMFLSNDGEISAKWVGVENGYRDLDVAISNKEHGKIAGAQYGVDDRSGMTLTNSGVISSDFVAVNMRAGGYIANNSSNKLGTDYIVVGKIGTENTATGILNAGASLTLVNNAEIFGQSTGVTTYAGGDFTNQLNGRISGRYGVSSIGRPITITNSGDISGTYIGVSTRAGGTITNTAGGEIFGNTDPELSVTGTSGTGIYNYAGRLSIENDGDIKGRSVGVTNLDAGDLSIRNGAGGYIEGAYAISNLGQLALDNEGGVNGAVSGVRNRSGGVHADIDNKTGASISGDMYGIDTIGWLTLDNYGDVRGAQIGFKTSGADRVEVINYDGGRIRGVTAIRNGGVLDIENRANALIGSDETRTGIDNIGKLTFDNGGVIEAIDYGLKTDSSEKTTINNTDGATIVARVGVSNAGVLELNNAGGGDGAGPAFGGVIWGDIGIENTGVMTVNNDGVVRADTVGVRTNSVEWTTVNNNANGVIGQGGSEVGVENAGLLALNNHGRVFGTMAAVVNDGLMDFENRGEVSVVNQGGAGILNRSDMTIENARDGTIFGLETGVSSVEQSDLTITNFGEIRGGSTAGVEMITETASIFNLADGTISGGEFGLITYGEAIGGVPADFRNELRVSNYGEISGGSDGILIGNEETDAIIVNYSGGKIVGEDFGVFSFAPVSLVNSAVIQGAFAAVWASDYDDSVELRAGSQFIGNVDGRDGRDTLRFGGDDDAVFDISTIGPNEQFRNFEVFEKTDVGRWALSGSDLQTNGTWGVDNFTIHQGELHLDVASMPGAAVSVERGGVLSGTGSVGSLTVRGVVSPNYQLYPGSISVDGPIVFEEGSTYEVDLLSANRSDRLRTDSSITINRGATLRVRFDGSVAPLSDRYLIMTYGALKIGDFTTVEDNVVDIDFELSGFGGEVTLRPVASQSAGASVSQKEVYPSALMASVESASDFTDTLMAQGGTASSAPSGFAGVSAGTDDRLSRAWWAPIGSRVPSKGALPRRDPAALGELIFRLEGDLVDNGFSLTADLGGGFSRTRISDDGVVPGWAAAMGGLVFGVDYNLREAGLPMTVGFASGFSRSELDLGASEAAIEAWHMGLYASHARDALSLSGALAYTHHHYDFSRGIAFEGGAGGAEAVSAARGDSFILSGEAFYDLAPRFERDGLRFGPVATIDTIYAERGAFTETGAGILSLTVDDDAIHQTTTGLGAAVNVTSREIAGVRVSGDARIAWEHVHGDVSVTTSSSIPLAEASFTSASARVTARDRAAVGLGGVIELGERLNMQARYDGVIDAAAAGDHRFTAGLSWRF